jgi:hypothetical protein
MEPEARVWWCTDLVHLLYSAGASAAAAAHLASTPAALDAAHPPAATAVPDAIVCVSAGFCAFLLWILVAYRCAGCVCFSPTMTYCMWEPFTHVLCTRQD